MGAFHVTPWLKWLSDRRSIDEPSVEEECQCGPR